MAEETHEEILRAVELRRGPSAAAEIATGMVRLVSRYAGRGPTKARTTLNTNLAVVVFEDVLTRGELNLVHAGQGDAVAHMRRTFASLLRDDAAELVERTLGRTVRSVISEIDADNNVAVVVFILERLPDTGQVFTAETP